MGRGRPRKDVSVAANSTINNAQPKRGRGRPKGSTKSKSQAAQLSTTTTTTDYVAMVTQPPTVEQYQNYQQNEVDPYNLNEDKVYKFARRVTVIFNFIARNIRSIVVSIIILVLAGAYIHQVHTNHKLMNIQQTPASTTSQAMSLRSTVAKLLVLPDNEVPTIATVTNSTKLDSESSFFSRAENGDKVLIFSKAKEVILFRPSQDKVVEAAPLDDSTPSTTTTSTTAK